MKFSIWDFFSKRKQIRENLVTDLHSHIVTDLVTFTEEIAIVANDFELSISDPLQKVSCPQQITCNMFRVIIFYLSTSTYTSLM